MRLVFGFLTTLIMSLIAIILLFALSPIFSAIMVLEPETSVLYSSAAQQIVDIAMNKAWIICVAFIVVGAVINWGMQIFRREQLEEEDEYEYWR